MFLIHGENVIISNKCLTQTFCVYTYCPFILFPIPLSLILNWPMFIFLLRSLKSLSRQGQWSAFYRTVIKGACGDDLCILWMLNIGLLVVSPWEMLSQQKSEHLLNPRVKKISSQKEEVSNMMEKQSFFSRLGLRVLCPFNKLSSFLFIILRLQRLLMFIMFRPNLCDS